MNVSWCGSMTRRGGCRMGGRKIRKGAEDAIRGHVAGLGGVAAGKLDTVTQQIADSGGTPLAVSDGNRILGIIQLKDVVKGGIKERFDRFRAMGIRTVMITGDNPRTAAGIPRDAGGV